MGDELKNQRLIGVVVPVGALRGEKSSGVGEFLDLIEFGQLCLKMGIGLIQLLPVNDTGYENSPYSALTAFALHPLYLKIRAIPEAAAFDTQITAIERQFEQEIRFPYLALLRAKMKLLREIYAAHEQDIAKKAQGSGSLALWIEKNPWVTEYAVYRRLKEANSERSWKEWDTHREVKADVIASLWNDASLRREHLFWVWIQEALDVQFSAAAKALTDMGIYLEGDLPILMNEDSCDVWAHAEYFHLELSAGAPPDMYSPQGQNWGFPTYNWQTQEKDGYTWWKKRLAAAEKYYRAYRIDHVLGFFRIWASQREDTSATLGRYIPYTSITVKDLALLGFDQGRIRWLSQPHIPTEEVWNSLKKYDAIDAQTVASEASRIFTDVLERIGNEELWLFKNSIHGEKDIEALGLHPAATAYLLQAWGNRLFLEFKKGHYSPVWYYRNSRAYNSLSGEERAALEKLLQERQQEVERDWEKQGKKLLTVLATSSSMLPCAEDLGAVPDCVPRVLTKLNILGLRVVRWFRAWNEEGQPYIPFDKYPELSVCTPSVHDSSTLREWWDREADQKTFCDLIGLPSLPKVYNPGTAKIILSKIASAASRFRVFQVQDLLDLSPKWYAEDPASERINVPGTYNEFNWTYRLPVLMQEIAKDEEFIRSVKELSTIQPVLTAKNSSKKGKK